MRQPISPSKLVRSGEAMDEYTSYDRCIERLRTVEYPMLNGLTYLDHAGTTLPSRTLMTTFSQQMQTTLLGNPHSSSSSAPNAANQIIESTRRKVLDMFGASPDHFEVVFVANATAGIKLVLEAFSAYEEGFDYYYHRDSHTSLVGIRELAVRSRCLVSDEEVEHWIARPEGGDDGEHAKRPTLFAYPAQSNMNGRRLPLSWPTLLRCTQDKAQTYTLLDVAALVSTSPIDLRNHSTAPDFLVLSFYKIFGFPDLGALIVRKSTGHVFDRRKYFGGGTTDMITCTTSPWHARKPALQDRLEDGTGPTHSILALSCAIDAHNLLFGSLKQVSEHTSWLSARLYTGLRDMRHSNGKAVCAIYKDPTSTYGESRTQGATVVFNMCRSDGSWIPSTTVGRIAAEHNILIRAGGLCNPAGMAQAIGIADEDLQEAYREGFRCGTEGYNLGNGELPNGMVRASLGALSTTRDVEIFLNFLKEQIVDADDQTWNVMAQINKQDEENITTMDVQERAPAGFKTPLGQDAVVNDAVKYSRPEPRSWNSWNSSSSGSSGSPASIGSASSSNQNKFIKEEEDDRTGLSSIPTSPEERKPAPIRSVELHQSPNIADIHTRHDEEAFSDSSNAECSRMKGQRRLRWIPRSMADFRMRAKQRHG